MSIHTAGSDGFIEVDVTISDLNIKPTGRINANPGFIMDRRSLSTVVRKGYQLTDVTLETFWHYRIFHKNNLPFLSQAEYIIALFPGTRQLGHRYPRFYTPPVTHRPDHL